MLAIAGLGSFVWWTLRSGIPVVDLHVLRLRQVAAGSILGAVLGVSLYGSILVLPQYLQNSLGFTAFLSGLTIFVRALAVMIFTPITAALASRGTIDVRLSTAIGFVLLGVSNWILAGVTTSDSQFSTFIVCLIISGIGLSQIFVPLSIAVIGGVPDREVPATSAFFNLSRQIGGSIATAVLVTLLVRGITYASDRARCQRQPASRADGNLSPTQRRPALRLGFDQTGRNGRSTSGGALVRRHVAVDGDHYDPAGTARVTTQ